MDQPGAPKRETLFVAAFCSVFIELSNGQLLSNNSQGRNREKMDISKPNNPACDLMCMKKKGKMGQVCWCLSDVILYKLGMLDFKMPIVSSALLK